MARRPRPKRAPAPGRARGKSHSASPLSPALLRSLIEHSPDAFALLDATGVILYANQTATHVLGHAVRDMIGRSAFDFVHAEDTPRLRQLFADVIAQPGIAVTARLRCPDRDGAMRRLEAVGVNRLDDPAVGAVILSYRDVTDRTRAELEGQEAESRYRKRAEQVQGATYRIAEAANTAADLPALLRRIHEIIHELMPARNFYIAVFDPATETLSFPYFVDEVDTQDMPRRLGKGLTEYVLRTGQPLLATPRVYEDLVARGEVELIGAPSIDWLGVPLKVHDRTIGVVVMQSYTEGVRYGEQERDILAFVSTQVALAIERKRAEDALRSAEDRYRAFIAQSTEGIWQFELERPAPVHLPPEELAERLFRDGYLAECNDAMAHMYGFRTARDIIGARLDSLLVRSDPKNIEFLRAFVTSGFRLTDVESHERDRDGHPKIFLNNMIGIVEDGQMVRAWGTQRDITEQRRLEEQIRQAVKVEAVGRLAGGIAHDFNNILTAILGTTQLLQRELGPEAPHYADVEEIRMAAERAADLTRQLLAYSRRQVLAPRVLDLNAVVLGLDHMLRRLIGEDVELTNVLAPQLAPVRADPGQLEQVIVNLAINARDAMPGGGTLTVDTANIEVDSAFARVHPGAGPGAYVRLRVGDTGVGMDAETRAHLFEPFFTTKSVGKGTGLGLATVYGIVKQSGGYIWVDSEPGRGTVFTILLPRTSGTPEPAASSELPAQPARGTETILLVEDEETVRTLSDRALNRLGYNVLAAPSGWDALRLAERHGGPIHLVLTDVVMPGLSGRDLVRQLATIRPGMQVLYISGYSDEAIAQHGVLDPGTAFLQKPFTPDRLASKVREVIDAANTPPRAAKTP